LKGSVILM